MSRNTPPNTAVTAHQHRDQARHLGIQRDLGAAGREQAQTQCIGPLHRPFSNAEMTCVAASASRRTEREQRPRTIDLRPRRRPPVEQHVAQGTATKRSKKRDHRDAHSIQPLACRLDDAGQRKGRRSGDFDDGLGGRERFA